MATSGHEARAFDADMMRVALHMAGRGLGRTWPNPSVGAVIADETSGELIARAVTAPGGRPHAETIAIAAAGERARGATIYVTLEPCSHHGLTGPCADAIVAAGLKRAIVAIEDPDPRVAGRGLDRLRTAGLEVVRGVGARDARWLTRGHIVRITERRPLVTVKLALGADGEIARGTGSGPRWVTGEIARAHGHLLRVRSDAILVGAGTVRDDDPELTCRLPGLASRSPVRVVLARDLGVALSSKLVRGARATPLWIVAATGHGNEKAAALQAAGATVLDAATVGGRLWLPSVLEALVARGITRLLVEGGPNVWRAFADAALIDEVILYMAGPGSDAQAEKALGRWLGTTALERHDARRLGVDMMWRYRRAAAKEG